MNADNSHAERQILARCIDGYDYARANGVSDFDARHEAIADYARLARLNYITAAERLADALARRAADKLKGESK